ncbi:MAG TPA: alpha/beta fold hydrolase [Actinomycetota bacterium]|jgi:pimeloyl-ACP methyl ester carboxylesterase|nr:alpha/beta fold hydrolase [Actinomycetota bacterium]
MTAFDRSTVAVSGGDLVVIDEGEGPAVLLLHGFPTSSHLWRDLVPILAVRHRVIAPDLLGYGASEKPLDAPLDVTSQTTYARELLDHFGVDRVALVGHDIGGGVAQLLTGDKRVEAVALIDPIVHGAWPVEGVRRLQAKSDVDGSLVERFVRVSFDLGMGHRDRLSAEDAEAYLAPWRDEPAAFGRAARALDGQGLRGVHEDLARFEGPAFVLWGEDDPFLPSSLAEPLGESFPDAGVALLPGCGHYVTEDAPETVLPIVTQFLRNRYLGEAGHDHDHGPVGIDLGVSFDRPPPPDDLVDE